MSADQAVIARALGGETATWTGVDRMRQWRGLILHVTEDLVHAGVVRRGIPTFGFLTRHDGICRWCRRPTTRRHTVWHRPCACAYFAAVGNPWLRTVVGRPTACPCGEPSQELDHRDSLAIASASGDVHRYRRALAFANLQWLCHNCHAIKTAEDRRKLRFLVAGPVPGAYTYGGPFDNPEPAVQHALFNPDEAILIAPSRPLPETV